MKNVTVNKILNFNDIILYWDYIEGVKEYCICLNNEIVCKTNKTHCTLRDVFEKNANITLQADGNIVYSEDIELPRKPEFIDITKAPFYAVGDGKTLNTSAIQAAIDSLKSGECLYVPKGRFLTGALRLHSDMEIYIAEGGVIKGSENPEDYLPKIFSRFEGYEMNCYSSLLNIGSVENRDEIKERNVKIYGGGTVEGGGYALARNVIELEKENLKKYMDSLGDEIKTYEKLDTIPGRLRPKLINISCTENFIIENIRIKNGSCWNIHMIYSKDIVTCNCDFFSHGIWNGDGWDPDSSENCTIFNCSFNTGDDCVAIKSGKNPEGNIINKPARNIKMFDLSCKSAHGFTIGSEMSGGVDGVYIWDCDMTNSKYGIEIKATKKRGGYVKNINMYNCRVSRVLMHSVGYNDDGVAAATVPLFKDCLFKNITITGESLDSVTYEPTLCDAIEMIGFGESSEIENVTFENLKIESDDASRVHSLSLQCLKNINFKKLSVK